MDVNEANEIIRTIVPKAEIPVLHGREILNFILPMAGPGSFGDIMAKVDMEGTRPTTAQTFSLINYALQNPNELNRKYLFDKLRTAYFWTSTENLFTPNEIIVYDNIDGKMPYDRKTLLERHIAGDRAIRVVSYKFLTGYQSVEQFLINPYVVAQIGSKIVSDATKNTEEAPCLLGTSVLASEGATREVRYRSAIYFDGSGTLF
jgi:hypothetical protein